MFRWYRDAVECYAYLEDVQLEPGAPEYSYFEAIRWSRWFTRGWTLQELLAPSALLFLDHDWSEIGTKSSLNRTISAITGIPRSVLLLEKGFESFSVAQRMSWAARRATTRVEDLVYCLLGLFDISMPCIR